jgi:hypothetical protein
LTSEHGSCKVQGNFTFLHFTSLHFGGPLCLFAVHFFLSVIGSYA